jgi:predicted Rossmann fold nucleotide-binding protein DprA/Smf involved in DNA uptake
MPLSAQTQAIVLLTAYLGKPGKGDPKPLSPKEWGRFAQWLKDHALQPESLLAEDPSGRLTGWLDRTVTAHRIESLLGRAGALGLALEKWERTGLWVMTRSDADYPERLKRRLKAASPPLLFGCGNRLLLGTGGLAVVGSRDAGESDLAFAAALGAEAAAQGLSIVSGGARGVDEAVMLGALEHEGTAVGVLADSLLRTATSVRYRKHLMGRDLVLVSPFNPEAGFEVGNAMSRNRYIYCLADAAVVVSSSLNAGGTWTGAIENLRDGWVPLWVKPGPQSASGNAEMVQRGARWLPDGKHDLSALMLAAEGAASIAPEPAAERSLLDLPLLTTAQHQDSVREISTGADGHGTAEAHDPQTVGLDADQTPQPERTPQALDFYELFLLKVKTLPATSALTLEQLRDCLELTQPQLSAWLKRAVAEGQIRKLNKPVRYRWQEAPPRQPSMFGESDTGDG